MKAKTHIDKKRAYGLFGLAVAVCAVIPALFLSFKLEYGPIQQLLTLIDHVLIFGIFLAVFLFLYHAKRSAWLKIVISLVAALYYLSISFIVGYWAYTGNPLDIFFFADSFESIASTAVGLFGWKLVLYIPVFLVLGIFYFALFMMKFHIIEKVRMRHLSISFLVLMIFVASEFSVSRASETPTGYISYEIQEALKTTRARYKIFPTFPDNSHYSTRSFENFFILQLESGNAMAVNGNLTINGTVYDETYNPGMREIAKDGIYFPYFWGNTIQTNRAQETILCGITNNLGKAFSYNLDEIPRNNTCLPSILSKMNYTTAFFRSDELQFANTGRLMNIVGMNELHYDDIMQEGDLKFRWGYDDCTFYKRAFEYLKKKYPNPERLFIYFEVSSHHMMFDPIKEYEFVFKFNPSVNFIEKYLNSFLMQDYCTEKFYEEFKNYSSQNSHLLILPDHSWPVGTHGNNLNSKGANNENFLVPLVYIPPGNKKNEFKIGKEEHEIFSETDIIPTIFDLLNGQSYQNSFAFALRGENKKMYENCHILIQPYDNPQVVIVNESTKYIYSVTDHKVIAYDLTEDWYEQHPIPVAEDLSYEDFANNYFCKRFGISADIQTIFSGPAQFGDLEFIVPLNNSNVKLLELVINATAVDTSHKIFVDGRYIGLNLCIDMANMSCRLPAHIDVSNNSTLRIESAKLANGSNDDYIINSVAATFRRDIN